MPFQPFTIDEGIKSVGKRTSVRVREGDYLVAVSGHTVSPEDARGANWFSFECKIQQGAEGIGKAVPFFCTMQDAQGGKQSALFGVGTLLHVTGNDAVADQLLAAGRKAAEEGRPLVDTYERYRGLAAMIFNTVKDVPFCATVGDHERDGKIASQVDVLADAAEYREPLGIAANGAPSANALGADAAKDDAFTASVDNLFGGSPTV